MLDARELTIAGRAARGLTGRKMAIWWGGLFLTVCFLLCLLMMTGMNDVSLVSSAEGKIHYQTGPGVGGKASQRVYAFRKTASEMSAFSFVSHVHMYVCMYGFRGLSFLFLASLFSGFPALPSCRFFCMYVFFLVFSIAYPLFLTSFGF